MTAAALTTKWITTNGAALHALGLPHGGWAPPFHVPLDGDANLDTLMYVLDTLVRGEGIETMLDGLVKRAATCSSMLSSSSFPPTTTKTQSLQSPSAGPPRAAAPVGSGHSTVTARRITIITPPAELVAAVVK